MRLTAESGVNLDSVFSMPHKLTVVVVLLALALALPKPARAGRLGADMIGLFPKDVGEFAYADLKKARTLKWFPQLQEQVLPDRFRQFELHADGKR